MSLSRRSFLRRSAAVAATAPLLQHLSYDFCDAAPGEPVDFSGGYAPGALRLNRNENPFGPSPVAIEAIRQGLSQANRYVISTPLRKKLAEIHGVEDKAILLSSGSGELPRLVPITFLRSGGNIVSTVETFRVTPTYAVKLGARVRWVGHQANWTYNTKALLDAVDSETKVFYLVNPNNPTGATLDYEQLAAIADALPKDVLFFIDEAYNEFRDGKNGLDLIKSGRRNVFVTRTFSKVYGLAGLRLGYGIGHPSVIKKVANFRGSALSLNLTGYGGALAALDDQPHVEKFLSLAASARAFFRRELEALDIPYVSGVSPFVLAEVGNGTEVVEALAKKNVFVRPGTTWKMPRHIRISFGLPEQNRAAIEAIKNVTGKA